MDSGRGKKEEWGADGRVGRCRGQGSTDGGGIEIRSQNEDSTGVELGAC